jgi:predicted DCC family thiol-disulfide oxidoreductase YuxK
VFAFSMPAQQSIVVDSKSPGGSNSPHGLILFDGVCILCSRGCRFVSKRDRRGYFRFVPIQLAEGRPLAEQLGIDPDRPDSFAFVAAGRAYVKSEAALRIARELPRWQWTWIFHFIPRTIRDAIYDLVAATAIAGSAVVTFACCRIRIVRGRREPRRDCRHPSTRGE